MEVLRLDFNSLKRIESDTFIHLKNLKFLDLSSNKITFIGLNGFRGLKKLKTLILNNNKIKTYSFDCIKNLKKLCMNDCSLTDDFNWRKLKYIENLTILELRHNFFTTLTAKFSQNILKLRRFILYDNEINYIDNEGLKYLTFLKTLDLSCNRLTQIDGNFFKGLKSLVTLNLSFNKISEVKNSFKDLNILQKLYLQDNRITDLDYNLFSDLNKLKILNLSNNQIVSILPNTFSGLENLEQLFLGKNFLKSIEASTFQHLDSLNHLDLQKINQSHGSRTEIDQRAFIYLKKLRVLLLNSNRLIFRNF